MRIHLIAVGQRMPTWIEAGYQEFARRLPPECSLHLSEIAPGKRSRRPDVARIVRDEGERILAALPKGALRVALEVEGRAWSTPELAGRLEHWLGDGRDVALMVGGPDGLSEDCRRAAELAWSLSPLTFPHALVRVMVAEQIYRAWTIVSGHPYHRA